VKNFISNGFCRLLQGRLMGTRAVTLKELQILRSASLSAFRQKTQKSLNRRFRNGFWSKIFICAIVFMRNQRVSQQTLHELFIFYTA
jgi:hypothetical protein